MKKITTVLAPTILALSLISPSLYATTYNVPAGAVDFNTGDLVCSLPEAMLNANQLLELSGGDCPLGTASNTIVLNPGNYTFTATYGGTVLNPPSATALPIIRHDILIEGNGAVIERSPSLFMNAACDNPASRFRLLFIAGNGRLTVNDATLQGGCASISGGAILNHGDLSLNRVVINNNGAVNSGGGIHNDGDLHLEDSSVRNNQTDVGAGGGIVNRGSMQILRSAIHDNQAAGAGGGIDIGSDSELANNTVSNNTAQGNGGAIYQAAGTNGVDLAHNTIAFNESTVAGGASVALDGNGNAIGGNLVGHSTAATNCLISNSPTDTGANFFDDISCDGSSTSPLGIATTLADNGGPTPTHRLLNNSPAIDASGSGLCDKPGVDNVDQRGGSRNSASCDSGSYELSLAGASDSDVPSLGIWALGLLGGLLAFFTRRKLLAK